MSFAKVRKSDMLVVSQSTTAQNPDVNEYLEVDTTFVFNASNDYRYNETDSTFYDVGTKPELVNPSAQVLSAFASKKVIVGGEEKSLYKRMHGVNNPAIAAGTTGEIILTVPYAVVKFTGAQIIGAELKDTITLAVLDTDTNAISGMDVGTYGPNLQLNQFGFDVELPSTGYYGNESKYDADLFQGMKIKAVYSNNGAEAKYIGINFVLHEVK